MKEFFGKVALITGAAHGIGYSFALEAASRGMKLALVDIDDCHAGGCKGMQQVWRGGFDLHDGCLGL